MTSVQSVVGRLGAMMLAIALAPAAPAAPPVGAAAQVKPMALWCEITRGFRAQDVEMNMGRVVIQPDLPVGAVIATAQAPIDPKENVASCFGFEATAHGEFAQPAQLQGPTMIANTYPTKVEGIGIRVWREAGSRRYYYPHVLRLPFAWWERFDLEGGQFVFQLVKTAEQTGTGSIADPGIFTRYYLEGNPDTPILTSSFNAHGTTIVYPTCEVEAGSRNIVVDFGQVPSNRFTGKGSRANSRDFQIRLTCQGSNVGHQQSDISVRLDSPAAIPSQPGVIAIDNGDHAATGIGVEVVSVEGGNETPVPFGEGIPLGSTRQGNHAFDLPLRARYIQIEPGPVRPGDASASATFTIEYD